MGRVEESIEKFKAAIDLNQGIVSLHHVYSSLSLAYYSLNQFDQALGYGAESLRQESNPRINCLVYEIIFSISQQKSQCHRSKQYVSKCIETDPDNYLWYKFQGSVFLQEQDYQSAIASYQKSLQLAIGQFQDQNKKLKRADQREIQIIYLKLSVCFDQCKQYTLSLHYANKALQFGPQNALIYTKIANCYLQFENHEKSMEYCSKAYERRLNEPQCCFELCHIYFKLQRFQQSLELAKLCEASGRKDADNYYIMSMSYYKLNQVKIAISTLEKVINNSKNYKIDFGLGEIYIGLCQFQEALTYLNQSLAIIQEKGKSLYLRKKQKNLNIRSNILTYIGCAYYSSGQYEEAIKKLLLAIQNPRCLDARLLLGKIYRMRREFEKEIILYNQFIKNNQAQWTNVLEHLGQAYSLNRQYPKALECFQRLINCNKRLGKAYAGIAKISCQTKRYSQSIEYIKKSLEVNVLEFCSYHELANVYLRLNAQKQTQSQIKSYIHNLGTIHKSNSDIYFHFSLFYKLIGETALSSAYFWKIFSPLRDEYEQHQNSLTLQSRTRAQKHLELYNALKGQANSRFLFEFEKLLLNLTLDSKSRCTSPITLIDDENKMGLNQLHLFNFVRGVENEQFRICVCQLFIAQLFRISHEEAIQAYRFLDKLQPINTFRIKIEIRLALSQNIQKIGSICNVLFFQNIKECELNDILFDEGCQLLRNMHESIRLYQQFASSLKAGDFQMSWLTDILWNINPSISEAAFLQKMIKPIQLDYNTYKDHILAKMLFVRIQKEHQSLKRLVCSSIKKFKSSGATCQFLQEITRLFESFFTRRYFTNQLIKYIFKLTHFLTIQYDQSIADKMIRFLISLKDRAISSFDTVGQQLQKLINGEDDSSNSQISETFDREGQSSESHQPSHINSVISQGDGESQQNKQQNVQISEISATPRTYNYYEQQKFRKTYYEKTGPSSKEGQTIDQKISNFSYLCFKNTYEIMRQLSFRGETAPHIPKYSIIEPWRQQFIQNRLFPYKMEEGELISSDTSNFDQNLMNSCIQQSNKVLMRKTRNGEDIQIVAALWKSGAKEIIKYILCLIKGQAELKEQKIYHFDIEFRNVIKVGPTYKLMDYDLALRFDKITTLSQSYINTVKLAKIIASCNPNSQDLEQKMFLQNTISYVFRDISDNQRQKLEKEMSLKNSEEEKANLLLKKFEEYASGYHILQLKRMMTFLIHQKVLGKKYQAVKLSVAGYLSGNVSFKKIVMKLQFLLKRHRPQLCS